MSDFEQDEYGNITNYIENTQPAPAVSEKKKKSSQVSLPVLIVTSLLCGILGGAIILGGYMLLKKGENVKTSYTPVATHNSASGISSRPTEVPETDTDTKSELNINKPDDSSDTDNTADTQTGSSVSPATAVAKKVLPSVVGIRVTLKSASSRYGEIASISDGTGVIITEDGYIVTNYHVISNMLTNAGEANANATLDIYLSTNPDRSISGTIVGYDIGSDLAVLKIEEKGLTAIEIGDSDKIEVGDIAIALGNPGGLEYMGSVSQGIISGLNRSIVTESSYENLKLIQTDAAINPGNSGGALVDVNGRLIGINSIKIAAEEYEGMGFAIPVNDVVRIASDIVEHGMIKTPYLGLTFSDTYTASYLKSRGYPEGLLIETVAEGSPADMAGLEVEDILTSFGGKTVTTTEELIEAKREYASGDTVTVTIYRLQLVSQGFFQRWTGEYYDVDITLG